MPQKGLSMRKIREILRLTFDVGLAAREVAKSCNVSHSTVLEYVRRAREAGLSWPLPPDMDDSALEKIVRGVADHPQTPARMPEIAYLIAEMKKKHVTLSLLWLEYKSTNPDGYQYTQFCHYYREEKKKLDVVLRQEHRAGEKLFTDYAGQKMYITDPRTGLLTPASIFVAVLGGTSYTYADATLSMTLPSWISSHIRALEYFGGAPEIIVPDNTGCAVIKADRYEPDLNPIFADMAAHYGCAVIPARVAKPRDKAPVETGVQVVERWILAALRNRVFFSIEELNDAIADLLERLNGRKFKKMNTSRRELFEKIEKPAMKPLPPTRYEFLEWKTAKVGIDYHISVGSHLYSVPYQLVGERVDVRLSSVTVEVLYKNRRVASHIRSYKEGGATTNPEHRPKSHQAHLEWTPSRIIGWAAKTGPNTAALVQKILETKRHPEMGYRSCLGIIRLAGQYTPERVEAASHRALRCNALGYKSVKSILECGLDRMPLKDAPVYTPPAHENLRGREYYEN